VLESYPVLNKDVRLRNYGESVRVASRGGRFRAFTVNRNGGDILNRCSGSQPLRDIVRDLLGSDPVSGELKNILRFVEQLDHMDVLKCPREPRQSIVDSAGSLERFTPQVVSLELTEKCNFQCRYCYQSASAQGSGNIQDPIEMLTAFHDLNVAGIELTGGEPLLHPRFNEIVAVVMANFEIMGLITNGSLLREHHLERLAAGPCMSAVQICLDGHTPALVEATTRVIGSFEMEINAIRRVKDFGIVLRVGMVVDSPEKIDAMEPTLLLARDLGADSFIAHPCIDFGRGADSVKKFCLEDHLRLNANMADLKQRYAGFFAREMESALADFVTLDNCGGGHRAITVDWRGMMKPCPMIPSTELNLGHWRHLEKDDCQRKMRAYHELKGPKADVCKDCHYLAYCHNCITRALRASKRVNRCLWKRKNRDLLREIAT